jgi:hypothetical protein
LLSGYDDNGLPFAITGAIHDISLGGISFFVNLPLRQGQILDMDICSTLIKNLVFRAKARVLRVSEADSGRYSQFVAAKFEGGFVQSGRGYQTEQMAGELAKSVEFDERMRRATAVEAQVMLSKRCRSCGTEFGEDHPTLNRRWCLDCHARQEAEAWRGAFGDLQV